MTQPCGYGQDLLNCPIRETGRCLVARPGACPTCNGAFADGETLQMIQGPWGCEQLVRKYRGGDFAIGNSWAGSLQVPQFWYSSIRGGGFAGGDTRFAGPYSGGALAYGPALTSCTSSGSMTNPRMISNAPYIDDCCYGDCTGRQSCYHDGYRYGDRNRQRRYHYQYKYRRSSRDGQGCFVM